MRLVDSFRGNAANKGIDIHADEAGPGGASHHYTLSQNQATDATTSAIFFQKGAIGEVGFNGITDEALISVLIDRLRGFQSGPFSCRENALALTKMEEAMHWLNERTRERVKRGVEGQSKA